MSNSTFSGNSAGDGGGIYNSGGTVTVSNSTFSGNSASCTEAAYLQPRGTMTVSNSTFTGNNATTAVASTTARHG